MRRAARRLLLFAAVGPAVTSLTLGFAGADSMAEQITGVAAGSATAVGVLAGYSDRETFYPGSPTEPPNTHVPYASGGFDNTGAGSASAALVYNPYQDFAGAINGLAPPGSPEVPAGALGARSRASVRGAPPQTYDASVKPGEGPTVGSMRAALDEEGPQARAEAVAAAGEAVPGVKVASATTRTLMSRADGKAHSVATSLLEGVSVNDVLTFRTIALDATSTAGGGPGAALASVRVFGAAVNGTAVELTEAGLVVAGTSAPLAAEQVAAAVKAAGIEVVAPGRRTVAAGGDSSVTTARGPSLILTNESGQQVELTLGSVSAVALLFNSAAPVDPPPGTSVTGEPAPPAAVSAAAPPPVEIVALDGTDDVQVASDLVPGGRDGQRDTARVADTIASASEFVAPEAVLQAQPALAATAPHRSSRRITAASAAEATTLTDARATERTELVYGVAAGVALVLVLASLVVPRGDLWSMQEG